MTAHMTPGEIAALRATISTLPIPDDSKRTWLAVIRMAEQLPDTHDALLKQCDDAMERYTKARKRATTLFGVSLLLNVATLGMLVGGVL